VISKPCHWHALPSSIRTLYELTKIHPEQKLVRLIEKGKVYAGLTREEAIALQQKTTRLSKPELGKLKASLATLLDVCLLFEKADRLQAYIRGLKRVRDDVTVQMFEQAVRSVRPELAKKTGDE
jgi:hypothetical protein